MQRQKCKKKCKNVKREPSSSSTKGVPDGVEGALDVGDVAALKDADDVEDTVHGADVRQEGIAKTLTAGGTLHETGDIGNLHNNNNQK